MKITIKGIRANAGLTQKEIAEKMGISTKTLQAWENGKIIPKPASVRMIADICGADINDIFLPTKLT